MTFAASAATAVATAKTVERERLRDSLKAAESERRRWARELHDETLQGLAGLQVLLSSAGPAADRATVDEAVGLAVGQIQEQIEGLRTLITELRPAALDQFGLQPALESLLSAPGHGRGPRRRRGARPRSAAPRSGDRDDDLPLRPGGADQRRQARPGRARARPADRRPRRRSRSRSPTTAAASIPQQRVEGFGLIGMHERAALVGGEMRVESSDAGHDRPGLVPADRRGKPTAGRAQRTPDGRSRS